MARRDEKRRRLKIRSGDQVEVISGKDRGKSGRVLRVEPARERLYVEGLNIIKRATRPSQVAGSATAAQLGGIIEKEGPIHVSNVMVLDPKGNRTRIGVAREDGRRRRIAKSTGAELE